MKEPSSDKAEKPEPREKSSNAKENTKMSERENEQLIDPPENQGGGGKAELDGAEESAAAAIDPPSNDGGN
jgi:hypothetical protein